MPGSEDRQPSPSDRAPASRVGDELQQQIDQGVTDPAEAQAAAETAAKEKGWDQKQTQREGGRPR